jgi:preprotein translocase subunit SecG
MAALAIVLKIIWSLAALTIVVSVLLHAAKGDGVAAIGGQSQLFASQKSAEKNLDRVSWTAVTVFIALSILLPSKWFLGLLG